MALNEDERKALARDCSRLGVRLIGQVGRTRSVHYQAVVADLRRDANLLEQAWSGMAQRNLLMDLIRSCSRILTLLNVQASRQPPRVPIESKPPVPAPRPVPAAAPRPGPVGPPPPVGPPVIPAAPRRLPRLPWVDMNEEARAVRDRLRDAMGQPDAAGYATVALFGYRYRTTGLGYSGDVDDWADMKQRCDRMIDAIRNAHTLAGDKNQDAGMLKIFMAPEFFFRGQNGAYDLDVIMGTEATTKKKWGFLWSITKDKKRPGILEQIRAEIDDPKYKDWLFVLGTAIGATRHATLECAAGCAEGSVEYVPNGDSTLARCRHDQTHAVGEVVKGARIDNVAFIVKDGEVHLAMKELVSHVDFIKSTTMDPVTGFPAIDPLTGQRVREKDTVTLRGEDLDVFRQASPSGYNTGQEKPPAFQDERMGGGVFTMCGITFGIEVCLDHSASTGSAQQGRLANASNIQIGLVPSAGMRIGKLLEVKGGLVFNVDGGSPHVEVMKKGSPTQPYAAIHNDRFLGGTPGPADNFYNLFPGISAQLIVPSRAVASGGVVMMHGPYDVPAP